MLYKRELYGEPTATQIETMGSIAVAVANRWALCWSERVMTILRSGRYLEVLLAQSKWEKDVLAREYAPHLARIEILQSHGVHLAPREPG